MGLVDWIPGCRILGRGFIFKSAELSGLYFEGVCLSLAFLGFDSSFCGIVEGRLGYLAELYFQGFGLAEGRCSVCQLLLNFIDLGEDLLPLILSLPLFFFCLGVVFLIPLASLFFFPSLSCFFNPCFRIFLPSPLVFLFLLLLFPLEPVKLGFPLSHFSLNPVEFRSRVELFSLHSCFVFILNRLSSVASIFGLSGILNSDYNIGVIIEHLQVVCIIKYSNLHTSK